MRTLPLMRKRKLTAVGPTPRKDENETFGDDINKALQLWVSETPEERVWPFMISLVIKTEVKWMPLGSYSTLVVPGGFSSVAQRGAAKSLSQELP